MCIGEVKLNLIVLKTLALVEIELSCFALSLSSFSRLLSSVFVYLLVVLFSLHIVFFLFTFCLSMSNNTMSYKYIKNNFPFFPFCLCYKLFVFCVCLYLRHCSLVIFALCSLSNINVLWLCV